MVFRHSSPMTSRLFLSGIASRSSSCSLKRPWIRKSIPAIFCRNFSSAEPALASEPIYRQFKPNSRRTGLIGQKVGMTSIYDDWGCLHAVSIIRVDDCHVVQVKEHVSKESKLGFMNIQIGHDTLKLKRASIQKVGHCAKASLPPKRILRDFKITSDAIVEPGTKLSVSHFLPGQLVDVSAISKGKGFAGGMKRWGFKGQGASHGVSKAHRSIGSTGNCQDPGKQWPGKKMAGHMGSTMSMNKSMEIFAIDPSKQCIFIRGSIPGPNNGIVYLRDAWHRNQPLHAPFPTHYPSPDDDMDIKFMDSSVADPFDRANTTPAYSENEKDMQGVEDMNFDDSKYDQFLNQ